MKVYVAAIFRKWPMARGVAHALELEGHECTSTWLRETEAHNSANDLMPLNDEEKRRIALVDLEDIHRSQAVVLLCETGDVDGGTRGGRHFETGYAYAEAIPIVAVGGPENVFHYLDGVICVASVTEALEALNGMEN